MSRHGAAVPPVEAPSVPVRAPRRGGMASWPIRRKLFALVAPPLLLIIGVGSLLTVQAYTAWRQAIVAGKLAAAAVAANAVTADGNSEALAALSYLRAPTPAAKTELAALRKVTDQKVAALGRILADPPEGGWSKSVQLSAAGFPKLTAVIQALRAGVDANPPMTSNDLTKGFFGDDLKPVRGLTLALANDLGAKSTDARTTDGAVVLGALANASTAASLETVQLTSFLQAKSLSRDDELAILQYQATQLQLLNIARDRSADPSGIDSLLAEEARINISRNAAIDKLDGGKLTTAAQAATEASTFSAAAGTRLQNLNGLVSKTAQDLQTKASSNVRDALIRMGLVVGLGLASVLLVGLFVTTIARTVTIPMRRLRSGAVDAATVRLPAAVRQIEREGPDAAVSVPPVLPAEVRVGPETREVAQALDGLTGEAVRLATSQVRLRQALDEAFVSMSRRSQSMVEKQLAIIDELESTEEDPEQLRNLFRLDHLAARMRRYNDNLLVLAGSTVRTRSAAPVPIADVFRAATSEMEQYERVRLQPLGGAMVTGAAAGGLIHLLAELLDNAAMYSPPTSPIVLSAAFTQDGGLHLEVTDSGVGIPAAELSDLNARLAMPGAIDTQVPSRMGLFVVARLAQRGGLSVRLAAREQSAGTVAEVSVPSNLVIGASTGPIHTTAAGNSTMVTPAEPPRLPAQHGMTATPMRGIQRPASPRVAAAPREAPPGRDTVGADTSSPGGAPGGLPSRRPGAALAGNPLGVNPLAAAGPPAPLDGDPQTRAAHAGPLGRQAPTPERVVGAPSALDGSGAWVDRANRTATPGASPLDPGPGATRTSGPSGAQTSGRGISGLDAGRLPRRAPGGAPPPAPFSAPGSRSSDWTDPKAGRGPFEPPAGGGAAAGAVPADRLGTADAPATRSTSQPLPVRGPGQPGGGPALGPSAATAAAAAAAARNRGPISPPTSGLFAATGPLTRGTGGVPAGPSSGSASSGAPAVALPPAAVRPAAVTPPAPVPPAAAAAAPAVAPRIPAAGSPGPTRPAPPPAPTPGPPSPPRPPLPDPVNAEPLPMEQAARQAAAASVARYRPIDPNAPMIGAATPSGERAPTPIFDSISVWFSDDRTAVATAGRQDPGRVIDLRDSPGGRQPTGGRPGGTAPDRAAGARSTGPSPARPGAPGNGGTRSTGNEGAGNGGTGNGGTPNRWATLGDQRWVATNARAASAPQTAGSTSAGLPVRRPGANLLPSAATAAAPAGPVLPARRTDAESVRGRLGSYQRGLSSARRARHLPADSDSAAPFNPPPSGESDTGRRAGGQGGDS